MSESEPKSAYELAMERLRRKDAEQGIESRALDDRQRAAIAEVRKVYEARLAEREIFHQSERAQAQDPESLEKLEQQYRRDRELLAGERDRKIEKIRGGGG